MRIATRLAIIAAIGLSLSIVSPVVASTTGQCQTLLATLRADTVVSQSSFTNQRDVTALVAKLDAAAAKLAAGKNADAVQKLVDFQTTLNALASSPKPKVDPLVARSLIGEAQGVIDCINANCTV